MKISATLKNNTLLALILAVLVSFALLYARHSLTIVLPFIFAMVYFAFLENDTKSGKWVLGFAALSTLVYFGYQTVLSTVPHEWDFSCFYLYGVLASKGMDIYNPESFAQLVSTNLFPHSVSDEFYREVVQVGFPYPPPSVFLFMGLSLFDYDTALIVWKIFHTLMALGSAVLMQKVFFSDRPFEGLLLAGVFILLGNSGMQTVLFSQTIFLLLFLLLGSYYYRDKAVGGILLSIAIFVKPFAIIVLIWYLLNKKYRSILGFALSCVFIFLITWRFTGIDSFFEYLFNNPAHRQPDWLFSEATNQSMLATLIRGIPDDQSLVNILYWVGFSSVALFTCLVLFFKRKSKAFEALSWNVLIGFTLIVYPSGQLFYNLIHVMGLFLLLQSTESKLFQLLWVLAFFLMQYKGLFFTSSFVLIGSTALLFRMEEYVNRISFVRKLTGYFDKPEAGS